MVGVFVESRDLLPSVQPVLEDERRGRRVHAPLFLTFRLRQPDRADRAFGTNGTHALVDEVDGDTEALLDDATDSADLSAELGLTPVEFEGKPENHVARTVLAGDLHDPCDRWTLASPPPDRVERRGQGAGLVGEGQADPLLTEVHSEGSHVASDPVECTSQVRPVAQEASERLDRVRRAEEERRVGLRLGARRFQDVDGPTRDRGE